MPSRVLARVWECLSGAWNVAGTHLLQMHWGTFILSSASQDRTQSPVSFSSSWFCWSFLGFICFILETCGPPFSFLRLDMWEAHRICCAAWLSKVWLIKSFLRHILRFKLGENFIVAEASHCVLQPCLAKKWYFHTYLTFLLISQRLLFGHKRWVYHFSETPTLWNIF